MASRSPSRDPRDVFGIVGATLASAFRVDEVVAEGGFAVVYRAHHAAFRATVALKCLKIPQYLNPEEQRRFLSHFHAEAELLFKLSASIPHVVRPLHVDAIMAPDGSFMPFLALEWLDGKTIDAYVREQTSRGGRPSLQALVELLTPVARALERAHRFPGPDGPVSIVHRDLKPENLFLARIGTENVVKILDFGIAKVKAMATGVGGRPPEDEARPEFFSPAYGAPEQWLPARYGHTGPWTDVWGLALTLVELAVGRPVITGDHAAMMGTATDPVRRPSPRAEGLVVSDAVESVFVRALAVAPRDRYEDAGQFWNALLGALNARELPAMDDIPELEAPSLSPPRSAGPRPVAGGAPAAPVAVAIELDLHPDEPLSARRLSSPPEPAPSSTPAKPTPPAAPAAPERVSPRFIPAPEAEPDTPLRRFGPPVALMGTGVGVTVLDAAYAASTGSVFALGPIRPTWVAALLVLAGVGLLAVRFLAPRDE